MNAGLTISYQHKVAIERYTIGYMAFIQSTGRCCWFWKALFNAPVKIEYRTKGEGPIDWRVVKDEIDFTLVEIPPDLEAMCREL